MHGLHLTADLMGCRCDPLWLTDADRLAERCEAAVMQAGLSAVAKLAHTFPASDSGPGGVTATVLLAESHLCVHTWPEIGAATLDVYVCNYGADHSVRAEALMASLLALFDAAQVERRAIERGAIGLAAASP
ncbi:adenosylmethionine decarboxylase [Variovorax sp. VNK109]|uniref:adenosylmethionine decarboxylase n=1 Tax=Variovorax sp. VNK109 TaxID=3400919 RepID=UPI003C0375DE